MSNERILIVEDEGLIALNLERLLIGLGYEMAGVAYTGREAIALATAAKPDLILMDIRLSGGIDGIEAGAEILKFMDVPILYLTSYSDEETIRRAKTTAPFGYLTKPVQETTLKSMIEVVLNRGRLERRVKRSEREFRELFQLLPSAALLVDNGGKITRANNSALIFFETSVMGQSFSNFILTEDRDKLRDLADHSIEIRMMRNDGTSFWARVQSQTVHEGEALLTLFVLTDISIEKERERLLQEKTRNLIESNEKLEHFAAVASHDLKAPARTSGLYLALLNREYGEKLDKKAKEYLEYALAESKKMQSMVEDLLEFSKMSHGAAEMREVSLLKVVRDTLAILSPEIEERRGDITYGLLPKVFGSELQLRRLFMNLVTNALKYNRRKKPVIHIDSEASEGEWRVSVTDNGIGILETEKEKIFDVFQRGTAQLEFDGTGMGLASCRQIMKNHEGKIWVESAPGEGSVFYLAFPNEIKLPAGGSSMEKNPKPSLLRH